MKSKQDLIRERAENDLETFIKLVHPQRVLGSCHIELINWWTRSDAKSHQLVLLPRDHMKSALVAFRVAQAITKDPTLRVLYISSTANLAEKQLKFIKDILTSDIYRRYWPDMVNIDESKREKWTTTEISVDHPLRQKEAVRDPTIFTAGLTTGITGMHCDIAVLDDVVVKENAYTQEGRDKVRGQYSLLASIEGADAHEWVVGTRYFPQDLYYNLMEMKVEIFSEEGEIIEEYPVYEIFERQVEDRGDGTGQYLWPRQQRYDGKWFGFDQRILAKKRSAYLDRTQFRAQYYNDPNDKDDEAVKREYFQYYEPKFLSRSDGRWFFKGTRLNVFAAIDFAFSLQRKADFSCVIVVGVDANYNYYVLDIDRFKTDQISDYFKSILRLHQKWDFRKLRCETTAAQETIVKDIKDNYIRRHGLALSIDHYKPNRHEGRKEERIEATLHPRYENRQIWHFYGGNCQVLEEELVLHKPTHDDVKDCLAACIDICVPPSQMNNNVVYMDMMKRQENNRFGGFI
jgi:hypothetical protein